MNPLFGEARGAVERQHGELVAALERLAGSGSPGFHRDRWQSDLGRGIAAIVEGAPFWDRAFVGFSEVGGQRLPETASAQRPQLAGRPWQAVGVSLVVHPRSPWVPAAHLNLRFFCVEPAGDSAAQGEWWFGGGFDLTPCYPDEADCFLWHSAAFEAVEPFAAGLYAEFKEACDRYFYLPHRSEARGVGGLFFDDFNRLPFADCLRMVEAVGEAFRGAYGALVEKYRDRPFDAVQKGFQLFRRGRYAEFNLALDRGTRFGLASGGRAESILASLPPEARWHYGTPPEHAEAQQRLADFLRPRNWLAPPGHTEVAAR